MNTRFREMAPGVIAEMIATRIEMHYVPKGLDRPEALIATWWAQEFLTVGGSYQRIGEGGCRLDTVLAAHATTVRTITDPVTGQEVTLSAAGAVAWLKDWFDYQHNLDMAPTPPPEDAPDPFPLPSSPPFPEDVGGLPA